ncbi:MAG: amylosucrase [Eubacterium sp.]|nr:amylosucrase [Eubacterium sp.]
MEITKREEQIFEKRFEKYDEELRWLYMELYDNGDMYGELCHTMRKFYVDRGKELKQLDEEREVSSDWYRDNSLQGMMLYIENFTGTIQGMEEKLSYLEQIGSNLIHLMPFFDTDSEKADGGYAIKDYRKVRKDLGTIEDLRNLAKKCRTKGMNLCCDFVMNHTSEKHDWAIKAKQGDGEYMSRYFFYDSYEEPFRFDQMVPQIYPATAPGNFTYLKELEHYVMTTFYRYEWDLNYQNPRVFNEMMYNFLFLANCGINVFRLDGISYLWKEVGTNCRNHPKVHTILRMMRMISEIVCPGVLFLGEVVMEPERSVSYFGTKEKPECHMLYNVTTMATTWHTVATRDVVLLKTQLDVMNQLPKEYVFLNYLRCHDDIGWGLDYDMLLRYGIAEVTHKEYLNEYFLGNAGYSNSRGELNRENSSSGDTKFCGTTASLCGIEKALEENNQPLMKQAIRLDLMLHAYMFMQSGVPVLYSGDEIGQMNDYSYKENLELAEDSRYLHRGKFLWEKVESLNDESSVEYQLFQGIKNLSEIRKKHIAFSGKADVWTMETWEDGILGIGRYYQGEKIIGLFNFSEHGKTAWIEENDGLYVDLITGEQREAQSVPVKGHSFRLLVHDFEKTEGY